MRQLESIGLLGDLKRAGNIVATLQYGQLSSEPLAYTFRAPQKGPGEGDVQSVLPDEGAAGYS